MQQLPNEPNLFTLTELVWQEDFRNWVLHPDTGQDQRWQDWLRRHPGQADILAQAREVVLALKVKNRPITDADIQQVIDITRQQLDLPATAHVRTFRPWAAWAAASVALLLAVGGGYWWQSQSQPSTNQQVSTTGPANLIEATKQGDLIKLADGSTVQLGANSQLHYPATFTRNKREVYLTGTATFDVKRDPDQPFLVYANGSVTRVLGTRFVVRAPGNVGQVTVQVIAGKVSVLPESEWVRAQKQTGYQPRTVIVTPNQEVVFERSTERMSKALVAMPALQRPVEINRFNFVQASVPQVFKTLEEAYGIPIVFDADVLGQCVVTAPLAGEPLFEKLDIICETIGARYEVVEAQIIISGKGCAM